MAINDYKAPGTGRWMLDEALIARVGCCLSSVGRACLAKYVRDVARHGVDAEHELLGDLLIALPGRY